MIAEHNLHSKLFMLWMFQSSHIACPSDMLHKPLIIPITESFRTSRQKTETHEWQHKTFKHGGALVCHYLQRDGVCKGKMLLSLSGLGTRSSLKLSFSSSSWFFSPFLLLIVKSPREFWSDGSFSSNLLFLCNNQSPTNIWYK